MQIKYIKSINNKGNFVLIIQMCTIDNCAHLLYNFSILKVQGVKMSQSYYQDELGYELTEEVIYIYENGEIPEEFLCGNLELKNCPRTTKYKENAS